MKRLSAPPGPVAPAVLPPPLSPPDDEVQSLALQNMISESPTIPAHIKANLIKFVKFFYCTELAERVCQFVTLMQVNTDFTSAYTEFIKKAPQACLRQRYQLRLDELEQITGWAASVYILREIDNLIAIPAVLGILYRDNDEITSVEELTKRYGNSGLNWSPRLSSAAISSRPPLTGWHNAGTASRRTLVPSL